MILLSSLPAIRSPDFPLLPSEDAPIPTLNRKRPNISYIIHQRNVFFSCGTRAWAGLKSFLGVFLVCWFVSADDILPRNATHIYEASWGRSSAI
ncbi:hypothetical protein BDV24DRAFT_36502 [Aspergillus arachidicola]|uniref:Uncharacterized protein n=1 Tax=Aspergillus arachidicola TaxID=656916 RepID=A0A5N6YQI5_9EURO|nr:hypothetical protein BDV24DRAFT_36502 [Aspergillus arachidicola]